MFLSRVKELLFLRKKTAPWLNVHIPKVPLRVSTSNKPITKGSISVIATALNEAENVERWLYSLLQQSLHPDEVVLCDGGSTDNTVELASKWRQDNQKLKVKIIKSPGANISKGRNVAVNESNGEVLLFSDLGSLPTKEWVKELSLPFLTDLEATVSLGITRCVAHSGISRSVGRLIIQQDIEIDPELFLASARSLGVSREAFNKVGGFPEELTLAGEDTLFNFHLRQKVRDGFYFSPNAVVEWAPPIGAISIWKMLFRYSQGDAEARLFYKDYLTRIGELTTVILGVLLALYSIYYSITRNQPGVLLITVASLCFAVSPFLAYQFRLKEYPLIERLIAPFILISAQAIGFISALTASKR